MPNVPKKKNKARKYIVKDKPNKEVLEVKAAKQKELEEAKNAPAGPKHKAIPLKDNEIPIWKVKLKTAQDFEAFPAAVSRRIEEGYQDERTAVSVDYFHDVVFSSMTRVRKTNRYLNDPVKRDIEICEKDSARKTSYRPLPSRRRIFEGLRPMLHIASDMHMEDWTTEFKDLEQELDLGPKEKRQKLEEDNHQQNQPPKKEIINKRPPRDEDEDEDVENAVPRHCVRIGLPTQSVASRQARKLQSLLEGVSSIGEYTWQAFVIEVPENVAHLSVEAAIRRSILIPDSIKSKCVNFPKKTTDFFFDPDAEDFDDLDIDADEGDIDGDEDEDEDEDDEDVEKNADEDDDEGEKKISKQGAAKKREAATQQAISYFQKVFCFELESADHFCLPKFIGGRVQHSNDIAGVFTVKFDTSS